jgi:hypothetical protein
MDPWCRTGRLTKKIQKNRQLSEDQVANQLCSNGNVLLKRTSTHPRVFIYSSQNFHQQREVFVRQERTPATIPHCCISQHSHDVSLRSPPDTATFVLEYRSSLKQNGEPCSKAKVPRTEIAATSTLRTCNYKNHQRRQTKITLRTSRSNCAL